MAKKGAKMSEYNIIEDVSLANVPKFLDKEQPFKTCNSGNEIEMKHLLGYAFCEKKKLKFQVREDVEKGTNCKEITTYTIIGVSHASD